MKKLFPILALSMVIGLFSSCIIVTEKPTYTVYFDNDTPSYIYDWYLKDKDGNNHVHDPNSYREIAAYQYDRLTGVEEDDYQFYFCLLATRTQSIYSYTESYYHIERDVTFYLSEQKPYNGSPRSAVGYEEEDANLVLKDSNGNEYPLKTLVINK